MGMPRSNNDSMESVGFGTGVDVEVTDKHE